MVEHNCKHEDKIIEIYGLAKEQASDIKWLCMDAQRRNGIMEKHIDESDNFRRMVQRNTNWRVIFQWLMGGIAMTLFFVVKLHLAK